MTQVSLGAGLSPDIRADIAMNRYVCFKKLFKICCDEVEDSDKEGSARTKVALSRTQLGGRHGTSMPTSWFW